MSPVTIHWCCLALKERDFVQASLQELTERLSLRYPQLPQLELSALTESEQLELRAFVDYHSLEAGNKPTCPASLVGKRLFVFCKGNEPFAISTRHLNPVAKWGAALQGYFALAWCPNNKFLVWHEAMHLLYADDCYERESQPCDENWCLMQYEPCHTSCGGDLYLCSYNLKRIADNG